MSAIFFPQRDFQGGKLNKLPWFIRVIMRAKVHILLVENYTHTPTLIFVLDNRSSPHRNFATFFHHFLVHKCLSITRGLTEASHNDDNDDNDDDALVLKGNRSDRIVKSKVDWNFRLTSGSGCKRRN